MIYTARVADTELTELLSSTGAVLIEGPKACGKTETARQLAASEILLDVDDAARRALLVAPAVVLSGTPPQLVDDALPPERMAAVCRTLQAATGC